MEDLRTLIDIFVNMFGFSNKKNVLLVLDLAGNEIYRGPAKDIDSNHEKLDCRVRKFSIYEMVEENTYEAIVYI